jgi:hypothetical protein
LWLFIKGSLCILNKFSHGNLWIDNSEFLTLSLRQSGTGRSPVHFTFRHFFRITCHIYPNKQQSKWLETFQNILSGIASGHAGHAHKNFPKNKEFLSAKI